ncbi:MAG: shikimate dehydrogenase [Oceanicaulis sp.]|uniref:shikimate dehydrogenase n=1 Tax=Glycocaulis sp. TaxID=1969725 RepID=UPI0025C53817|nr:shikimate dehydrogenase [Glycocaulis sp.]MCC5980177.1 shikimate dehydrogenase [Oceanicaulis sp.]MCH8521970.1 shikimate dehydrogenase [Glycocaulis sp.]
MTGGRLRAGVMGWPVGHSLSPVMMTAWLQAAGIAGSYEKLAVEPSGFEAACARLKADGFSGVNITIPHKEAALRVADTASDAARAIGAANVLRVTATGLHADNTDIAGIRAALDEAGWQGDGPVALVGAGGAARAALYVLDVLASRGIGDIRILNRTPERAQKIAQEMGVTARIFTMDDASHALEGATLLVNATSLGMAGQPALMPAISQLEGGAIVFDMVYVPLETPLLAEARKAGLKTADGLSMLIGQARPAFEAFFGAPPPVDVDVRALMEAALEPKR